MITQKNLLYSTFIGLFVEVSNSSQQDLIGAKGIIVNETKNLIVIEDKKTGAERKIPKVSCSFSFTLDGGEKVEVDGRSICFRPHERPKKV